MIEFFHECTPPTSTAQMRRHTVKGKTYLPPSVKNARAKLRAIFELYAPESPLKGPLTLTLVWTWAGKNNRVYPKVTRPDLDNLAKDAVDAMVGCGFMKDDAQIAGMHLVKYEGPMTGIYLKLENMEDCSNEN